MNLTPPTPPTDPRDTLAQRLELAAAQTWLGCLGVAAVALFALALYACLR